MLSPLETQTSNVPAQIQPNAAAIAQKYEEGKARENETQADRKFITELFARLNTTCSAGFHNLKSLAPDEANEQIRLNMRDWLNEFMRVGMNDPVLVDYALGRLRAKGTPFIPTVGEFLALCEEGKIPAGTKSHADAWKEIKGWLMLARDRRKPSDLSNEVFHTYNRELHDQMAFRERTNTPEQREAWQQAYTRTIERLKAGKTIAFAPPPDQMQLEKKPSKPASKEFAASFLAEMKKGLSQSANK